jgi:hypothetical protein
LIVDRINAFSYAANVHYASLNIMFLTVCKFCNFLASVAAIFENILCLALVGIVSARGAGLSELNVKLRGCAFAQSLSTARLERTL